jgi:hypothetical protein
MATPVDSCAGCSEGPHIVQSLYDGLRKGTTGSFKETCYIPNDVFNNLFTREKISRAITAIFPELQNPEREKLIDQIDPPSKIEQHETRKKLFAILIKMQIPRAIISFVKDGVSDRHLPFRTGPGDKWLEYRRDHASNQYYPITSFRNDPIDVCELFVLYQWRFLAPFFHFTKTEAPHYSIQPRDIPLPFAEEDPSIRKNGGFGQVCKVKIHQAHHDLGVRAPRDHFGFH